MGATPAQSASIAATPEADASSAEAGAPLCFVVDTDASIRHFLSLVLHGCGIDNEELPRRMLPVLKKPFETSVVLKVLQELRLGDPPAVAGRVDLREALRNRWIEFWYQPKIDLRKKQLIGVEAYSRARHPRNGVLEPSAFMPGASEGDLVTLSELALEQALQASLNFSKLGVNLRPAVNIPINALVKVAVADIVESHREKFEKWPGLIIDVAEEQIVSDLPLA